MLSVLLSLCKLSAHVRVIVPVLVHVLKVVLLNRHGKIQALT
jgi:hypothetical protein